MPDDRTDRAEREAMAAAWDAEGHTPPWHFLPAEQAQAVERVFRAGAEWQARVLEGQQEQLREVLLRIRIVYHTGSLAEREPVHIVEMIDAALAASPNPEGGTDA